MKTSDIINRLFGKELQYSHKDLKELIEGKNSHLYYAFCGMNTYNERETELFGKACTRIVGGFGGRELADRLAFFRAGCYLFNNVSKNDIVRTKKICGGYYPNILAVGMCSSDGYIRMYSAELIADYPQHLPLMAYTFNDWVPNVRRAAENSFMTAVNNADTVSAALAYAELYDLQKAGRRSSNALADAENILRRRLTEEFKPDHADRLAQKYNSERAFHALISDKVISRECAKHIIELQNYPISLELMYIRNYDIPFEELIEYTNSRKNSLHSAAAQKLIDTYGLWDSAETLLADRVHSVRELMQYYFRKWRPEFDMEEYYKSKLPNPAAIMGLGEIHSTDTEDTALKYIDSENARTAAAAVYALCSYSADKYSEFFFKMLPDSRLKAAKAAFRALMITNAYIPQKTLYENILENRDNSRLCIRYASLLCRPSLGIWEAMPYLIRLYSFPEEKVQALVRRAIEKRGQYFTGGDALRNEIRLSLSESENFFSYSIQRDILFQIERT